MISEVFSRQGPPGQWALCCECRSRSSDVLFGQVFRKPLANPWDRICKHCGVFAGIDYVFSQSAFVLILDFGDRVTDEVAAQQGQSGAPGIPRAGATVGLGGANPTSCALCARIPALARRTKPPSQATRLNPRLRAFTTIFRIFLHCGGIGRSAAGQWRKKCIDESDIQLL